MSRPRNRKEVTHRSLFTPNRSPVSTRLCLRNPNPRGRLPVKGTQTRPRSPWTSSPCMSGDSGSSLPSSSTSLCPRFSTSFCCSMWSERRSPRSRSGRRDPEGYSGRTSSRPHPPSWNPGIGRKIYKWGVTVAEEGGPPSAYRRPFSPPTGCYG